MKKISKSRDSWNDLVIYVSECNKYEYEKQEVNIRRGGNRIYDIMYKVEDYYE